MTIIKLLISCLIHTNKKTILKKLTCMIYNNAHMTRNYSNIKDILEPANFSLMKEKEVSKKK